LLFTLVGLGALAVLVISALAMRHLAPAKNADWEALGATRDTIAAALQGDLPPITADTPHKPPCTHPKTREVWDALAKGNSDAALECAEMAMATDRENSEVRLLLAVALLANRDFAAAGAQLETGQELGAHGPLARYLAGRIEIEQYLDSLSESASAREGTVMMPAELLALDLHVRLGSSGDASALWMPGQGEVSQEEAREFVLVHFSAYYRVLGVLLDLMKAEPFLDGMYHLGRMALKCGFSEEGGALLLSLEGRMQDSEFSLSYKQLMALLRGEKPVATETKLSSGRKVVKLNILN